MLNNTNDTLLMFGFLRVPGKYKTEYDAVLIITALMALFGILANVTLLLVIIRDPKKQLRTNTAILVGFNGVTNLIGCLWFSLERILAWSGHRDVFTPQLTIYLGICNGNIYFFGSLLLALNCYGAIVEPLRYKRLALKQPSKIMSFLAVVSLINYCVFTVIPCALPDSKTGIYIQVMLTMDLVIFAGSTVVFIVLYVGIFRSLFVRREMLHTLHRRRLTQTLPVVKQNDKVAKTLFIHLTYLVFASVPGIVIFMLVLYCSRCDSTNIQLLSLYVFPIIYSLYLFHPILWLCRMKIYRQALKQICGFSQTAPSPHIVQSRQQTTL